MNVREGPAAETGWVDAYSFYVGFLVLTGSFRSPRHLCFEENLTFWGP